MELNCPKCGSALRVIVDQDAKVSVELVQAAPEKLKKPNMTSAAPRSAEIG